MNKIFISVLTVISLALSSCASSGYVKCSNCNGQGTWDRVSLHTGFVTHYKCTECNGTGQTYYDATDDNIRALVSVLTLGGGLIYAASQTQN